MTTARKSMVDGRRSTAKCGRDPETAAEWQEAVDAARFFLLPDSAIQYGLVTGPKVDADRCQGLLDRGRALGFSPAGDEELLKRFLTPAAIDPRPSTVDSGRSA